MKLGLGLYKHQLNREHYDFARQCGATHIVAHLVDYFKQATDNPNSTQPTGGSGGWGIAGDPDVLWSAEELIQLREDIEAAGLKLAAIENFDPAHWYDVLLDGPRKAEQLENLKTIIQNLGQAGIPVMGYNFSIAGVAGRLTDAWARGGAVSPGLSGKADDTPIPNGMVWNMVYDTEVSKGTLPEIDAETLWQRLTNFLQAVLPTAETAGVTLAAHPDDPPVERMRRQPRLVYQPQLYQKLIDINTSPSNQLEFCVGTVAEMSEGDIYEAVDNYSRQNRIAYIHLRNIAGRVPNYHETFIDDGDIDMVRILSILKNNQFQGVIIPDHAPVMSCPGSWHAGMAHTLGYIHGVLQATK